MVQLWWRTPEKQLRQSSKIRIIKAKDGLSKSLFVPNPSKTLYYLTLIIDTKKKTKNHRIEQQFLTITKTEKK